MIETNLWLLPHPVSIVLLFEYIEKAPSPRSGISCRSWYVDYESHTFRWFGWQPVFPNNSNITADVLRHVDNREGGLGHSTGTDTSYVVQRYIMNPLLINGYNWVMRKFVLVLFFSTVSNIGWPYPIGHKFKSACCVGQQWLSCVVLLLSSWPWQNQWRVECWVRPVALCSVIESGPVFNILVYRQWSIQHLFHL